MSDKYQKSKGGIIRGFNPAPSGKFARRVLHELGIKGALIGRMAVWSWIPDEGQHQYTKDVDIAVRQEDLVKIKEWIYKQNLPSRELIIGGINVYDPNSNINVDFIDRASPLMGDFSVLFSEAIRFAKKTVSIGSKSIKFPVVSQEYLIAMKLVTGEQDDHRDIVRLLQYSNPDIKKTRDVVKRHLGPIGQSLLEQILIQTNHPLAIEKKDYK